MKFNNDVEESSEFLGKEVTPENIDDFLNEFEEEEEEEVEVVVELEKVGVREKRESNEEEVGEDGVHRRGQSGDNPRHGKQEERRGGVGPPPGNKFEVRDNIKSNYGMSLSNTLGDGGINNLNEKDKVVVILSYINVYVSIISLFYKKDGDVRYNTLQALIIHVTIGILKSISSLIGIFSEDFSMLSINLNKAGIIVPLIVVGLLLVTKKNIKFKALDGFIDKLNNMIG